MRSLSVVLFAVACAAAPTSTSDTLAIDKAVNIPPTPKLDTPFNGINTETTPAIPPVSQQSNTGIKHLVQRTDYMTTGKQYNIFGWVFTIGFFAYEELGGTSMQFPSASNSVAIIAKEIIKDLATTNAYATVKKAFGDGWTYTCQILADNYSLQGIPSSVIAITVQDAINAAKEAYTYTNTISYILNDTNGKAILELILKPTQNNGQAIYYHDELKRSLPVSEPIA